MNDEHQGGQNAAKDFLKLFAIVAAVLAIAAIVMKALEKLF